MQFNMHFLHSVYGKAFSSLMMFKDIYMFGNDKTTFDCSKHMKSLVLWLHIMEKGTKVRAGREIWWFLRQCVDVRFHSTESAYFTCKVGESVVCTLNLLKPLMSSWLNSWNFLTANKTYLFTVFNANFTMIK